ncbi:MAG: HlyD family type I secretion periplasmic adaptor subunit [Neomegalonema sp.]
MDEPKPALEDAASTRAPRASRGWIWLGMGMVLSIFGGLGAWGSLAPIDSAVIAPGEFIVDAKRRTVQHLEGGIVDEILVRDGDLVGKDVPLVRLSDARARASLAIVDLAVRKDLALEARLLAERDGEAVIEFPPELLAQTEDDAEVAEALMAQQRIFDTRRDAIDGEIEILMARIGQFEREIEGLDAQAASKSGQIELIEIEIADQETLFSKGQSTKSRLLALKRARLDLLGERGEREANSARTARQIGETQLEIMQRRRAVEREATGELEEVQARLRDLSERKVAAVDVLSRLQIAAPVEGVVVNLSVNTIGQVIQPGQILLELVPADVSTLLEVRVPVQDVDDVERGQVARLRLLAYNQRTTPEIDGVVDYLAADATTDETTGFSYFRALIRVPDDQLARLDGLALQPGLPAEALIRTGARTAVEYLTQPLVDSINRAWREN